MARILALKAMTGLSRIIWRLQLSAPPPRVNQGRTSGARMLQLNMFYFQGQETRTFGYRKKVKYRGGGRGLNPSAGALQKFGWFFRY
jgi:hypothetical protein